MKKRPSFSFRVLFVDKSIQIPLIIYTFLISGLTLVLTLGVSALLENNQNHFQSSFLQIVFLGAGAIVAISCLSLVALYVSNKVAGPIFRMKQHMEAISRGSKKTSLKSRQGDFMDQELFVQYNKLLEELHRH